MTTKISSRRAPGWWTTYADTLKRNRGVLIFSLLLMLAAPLHPLLFSHEIGLRELFSFSYHGVQSLLIGISAAVPMILSVAAPFMVFHYLHNRRAVDLYHALPVKRASLFMGKFLTGLTMVMLPAVAGLGSAWLITVPVRTYDQLADIAWQVILFALCLYVFAVFVIVCCGTVWESILYGTGLMIAVLCIAYSVPEFASQLYGYTSSSDLRNILLSVTPFYYLVRMEQQWDYLCLVPLVTAGVLFGLSILLYQNRKSENTGLAFSYRFLFHIISVFISIAIVLFIYIAGRDLLSAILLGFLGYFVMSVIANRGFKKLLPVILRGAGIVAVTAAFIITFFATDGFGYEDRIPALAQIESVSLSGVEVGDYRTYMSYSRRSSSQKHYQTQENIKLVHALHQELLEEKDDEKWYDINVIVTLEYRLKNGATLKRSYSQVSKDGFEKLIQLNQSQEFLLQRYPFLADGFSYGLKARAVSIVPFSEGWETIIYENLGIAADEVAAALKKDILARPAGFETAPTADFVGRLAILYPGTADEWESQIVYTRSAGMSQPTTEREQIVAVYECDRNILALLEKRGKLDSFRETVTSFATMEKLRLSVTSSQNKLDMTSRVSNSGYHHDKYSSENTLYLISDPEDRAFLLKHLQPVYYSDTPCSVVVLGEPYCFLLPNEYQPQLSGIISRATVESAY